ncbi:Putative plasmid maintenance system antidote protein, XRE family (modular protein) [Agrobacterium deltaense Zutra 3/1]|uniref:Putative plasmid maintenance system antidote protein, XRE family (Modular protein) n=1 Tax=Agrobacterium deltaense Zutra 3/1 TaxID=1183427 RepID=A0A1S7QQZ0_9HYPH|nr:Putative plasmid maintenance system antidote protein, XRE family (modular protein) [Agrobacterium deltaense Zutra 3/1]
MCLTKICLFGTFCGMDALSTFLGETGEKLSTFAVRIGRSPSTLSRAISGRRDPSIDLARDVERGTRGRVSTIQFIEICLKAQKRGASSLQEAAE